MIKQGIDLLRRFEVNQAVFFSSLTQGWSIFAGPMTIIVIAHGLSAVEQGFYYTFSSVLALQVFVELGLATVIVQFSSHEWAQLKRESDSQISGDARALSRLASLLRFALNWYAVSSISLMLVLGAGGYCFFMSKPHPEIAWQAPWYSLCFIAGVTLMLSPVFSLLEGCNQVSSVYTFRFVQNILVTLSIIVSLLLGMNLYSLAVGALIRLLAGVVFLGWRHLTFLRSLLKFPVFERMDWKQEVWPFQWRIGVSYISGYFIFSIFPPVMFYFHGPEIAGQMGMTWGIVAAIESFALPWVNARMPQFGILIALGQRDKLMRLFKRLSIHMLGVALIGGLSLWIIIFSIHASRIALSERLLPMISVTLLITHRILNVGVSGVALFMRAHKQEPIMLPSLVAAILVGLSTLTLGARFGPLGASSGLLAVALVWGVPSTMVVFKRFKVANGIA